MRTLACNCRGAGKASTVRSLRSLIRNSNPYLVFLSETKIKALRVEKITVKLNLLIPFAWMPMAAQAVWPFCGDRAWS